MLCGKWTYHWAQSDVFIRGLGFWSPQPSGMQPRFRNHWNWPLSRSWSCSNQADLSQVKKSASGNMEKEKDKRQKASGSTVRDYQMCIQSSAGDCVLSQHTDWPGLSSLGFRFHILLGSGLQQNECGIFERSKFNYLKYSPLWN